MTAPRPHHPERKEKGTHLSYQRLKTQQTPSSSHLCSTLTAFLGIQLPWASSSPRPLLRPLRQVAATARALVLTHLQQLSVPTWYNLSSAAWRSGSLHLVPMLPITFITPFNVALPDYFLPCSVLWFWSACYFLLDCLPGQSHPIIQISMLRGSILHKTYSSFSCQISQLQKVCSFSPAHARHYSSLSELVSFLFYLPQRKEVSMHLL